MPKQILVAGTTSFIDYVRVTDMNGSPITGLLFNSTGLLSKYVLAGAASVAITLATQTVTGAYSSGGLVEVDAVAFPGLYRFDIPDAALASGNKSFVSLYGFSGMNVSMLEYELTAFNLQSAGVSLTAGQLAVKKNTALSNFPFIMSSSTNGAPLAGLTVTATRRIDNGSFGACANAVTEIANGWYTINLAAADLNGVTIALRFAATGAFDRDITIVTQA